jgi:glycosyltransferase involved in cell wall biosynthesis
MLAAAYKNTQIVNAELPVKNNIMRILCICYENMAGRIGGVRQVMEIGEHLIRHGHRVEILAPGFGRYKKPTALKIRYVPTINRRILRSLIYHLLLPFYLLGVCLRFRPDVILIYEIFATCFPSIIARVMNLPYVVFVNGDIEDFEAQHYSRLILNWIDLMRRINFKFTNGVITISDKLKEIMYKKYRISLKKITILNNAADPDFFKPMERDEACRILGLTKECFYVGFLGGLYPWHGVDYLIKSAPLVLDRYPEVNFIIAGHGPLRNELMHSADELGVAANFMFPGEVSFDLVPTYINAFDICVVFFKPIRKNPGSPIKLFEYLACAKPVIASDAGGYGALVERLEAGIGVDAQNPKALAGVIITLLENKDLREMMGRNGRDAVIREFSWSRVSEILEDHLSYTLSR